VDAAELEVRQLPDPPGGGHHVRLVDPELAGRGGERHARAGEPGARVHAQQHRLADSRPAGGARNPSALVGGLQDDQPDAPGDGRVDLPVALGGAGVEHVARAEPGGADRLELPEGADVGAAAEAPQLVHEGEAAVGLERVGDAHRRGQRAAQGVDAGAHDRQLVEVERRAVAPGPNGPESGPISRLPGAGASAPHTGSQAYSASGSKCRRASSGNHLHRSGGPG
jgi:hypothetical protein